MEFGWSEEQLRRREEVVAFARAELGDDDLVDRDREGLFSRDNWGKCARFGVLGLSVPEEYGGAAVDLLTAMLVMEGLGYGCADNGLTFALNAQLWTVQLPIVRFGTDDQRRRFLPDLCAGRTLGAHALTEPDAGSDAFSLRMRADRKGDGYVLNGVKRLVTLGPVADVALVFAASDPDVGKWGISAFLVERGMSGFNAGAAQDKMGLRTVPLARSCWTTASYRRRIDWGRKAPGSASRTTPWRSSVAASSQASWAPWSGSWRRPSSSRGPANSSDSPSATFSRCPTASRT